MKNQRLGWKLKYHQQLIRQNQLEEKGNVVIVGNMDITGENAQTISKQYNNTVTGVELVCVTLTKHKLLIPY